MPPSEQHWLLPALNLVSGCYSLNLKYPKSLVTLPTPFLFVKGSGPYLGYCWEVVDLSEVDVMGDFRKFWNVCLFSLIFTAGSEVQVQRPFSLLLSCWPVLRLKAIGSDSHCWNLHSSELRQLSLFPVLLS